MQVQDTKINPPASDVATKLAKVSAPPIQQQPQHQRPVNQRTQSCFIRASSLDLNLTASSNKNNGAITQDDIDAHRGHNGSCKLLVSEATRQVLDSMDASQVDSARQGFARAKLIRKQSGINPKDLGKYSREVSDRILVKQASNSDDDDGVNDDAANDRGHHRSDYSTGGTDTDSGSVSINSRRFSMSTKTSRRVSMPQSFEPTVRHPHPRRGTAESRMPIVPQRPSTLSKNQQSGWKPMSSDQLDLKYDDEEKECEPENKNSQHGSEKKAIGKGDGAIGNLWNKVISSLTQETTDAKRPKKQRSASSYFRRGKKKADECQFLQAVALYNFALIRQREELGENHIDCGTTLNEIGVCWMMLGERYPALTALEEALYIRKKKLGDGAKEIAETTANILMVFEEEREDMECMVQEDDG